MNRRMFLRGLGGVAIALPTLEIMLDSHGEALADGKPIPKRLIAFIAAIVSVRSTKCFSENAAAAAAYAASEACVSLTRVTSSAHARAARSCSENRYSASCQTGTRTTVSTDIPSLMRSRVWMSMQWAHPFNWETRKNTK